MATTTPLDSFVHYISPSQCVNWIDKNDWEYVEPITLAQASYLLWRFKEISAAPLKATEQNYSEDCVSDPKISDITSLAGADPPAPAGVQAHPVRAGSVQSQSEFYSIWPDDDDLDLLPLSPRQRICGMNTSRTAYGIGGVSTGVSIAGPSSTNVISEIYDGDKLAGAPLLGYGVPMNTFTCSSGIFLYDVCQLSYGSYALDNTYEPRPEFFDPLTWWGTGIWYGGPEGRTPESVTTSTDIAGIPLIKAEWTAAALEGRFNSGQNPCGPPFSFELPNQISVEFWEDSDFE